MAFVIITITAIIGSLYKCISGVPGGSAVRNPPANAGDADLIPGSERSPRAGNDNPLQCSCQGKPMDKGSVPGVSKSQTLLSG